MVDIHCHILPGVDDGARSFEAARQMAQIAAEDGIRHIVATPHCNDEFRYDRGEYEQLLAELQRRIGNAVTLHLGCDFHFSFDNVQDALADTRRYTIAGGSYLLVEFSDFSLPPHLSKLMLGLRSAGLQPIVTHPERNLTFQAQPDIVFRLLEAGCLMQVTANSITGHWGETARRTAQWMFDRQAVHFVATDAHNTTKRPPVLSAARAAVRADYGEEVALALFELNPAAVLADQPLPYIPEPVRR